MFCENLIKNQNFEPINIDFAHNFKQKKRQDYNLCYF